MTDTSATAALAAAAPAEAAPAPSATPAAPAPAEAAPAPAEPGLTLPGKDASPEQWQEFYGKLGRPEKADDYGLQAREGASEHDKAMVAEVAGVMHKYGLTKEQATGLQKEIEAKAAEVQGKAEEARIAAQDIKNEAEQKALKTELGERYEPQMELARRAVRQFAGGEQAGEVLAAMEDKLGYKATIELWMRIGQGLGEHDATSGGRELPAGERKSTQQILYGG